MSPTTPTFVTLNDQLNKAHHRVRELQARETERLLGRNGALHAVITELTREDHVRTAAELTSSPQPPAICRQPPDKEPAKPRECMMFNLDPAVVLFLIVAAVWLIAALLHGGCLSPMIRLSKCHRRQRSSPSYPGVMTADNAGTRPSPSAGFRDTKGLRDFETRR